ncbi:hypothetical protein PILCRDRAFT_7464 [Piloderma croceum F 1598]|uniref:Uncharacterized protein n=1 Tax=Piloderma croceum (strain F 1598) TaxID=765440 RepID=A0A0C3FWV2_PILCF|nr:hypothetical protein PILCRDRAFT_7464 [Piloderma croceum F 1598]
MSKAERTAATKAGKKDLERNHEMKALDSRNMAMHAFHDAHQTIDSLEKEIHALHARTGIEVLLIATRSKTANFLRPYELLPKHMSLTCITQILMTILLLNGMFTRNDIELLLHSWKNGSTKFRRLSNKEFEKWEQERFQSALDEMTMNEYNTSDRNEELNLNNQPADQPEPHKSSSSSHIPRAYPPTKAQPNPANQPTPPPSMPIGSKRPSQEPNGPATSKRPKPAPLRNSTTINTLTSASGAPINVAKAPRKQRSDKGKKRGPHKKAGPAPST